MKFTGIVLIVLAVIAAVLAVFGSIGSPTGTVPRSYVVQGAAFVLVPLVIGVVLLVLSSR